VRSLLPSAVVLRESTGPVPDVASLPEELALAASFAEVRRREFLATRERARAALAELGHADALVGIGPRRAPVWPGGVVGSITHCAGYRAVAVARAGDLRSLGIDAEPAVPLEDGVADQVLLPAERARLRDDVESTVVFSAKESVYKAWHPLTGGWLGFEDVEVALGEGTFAARVPDATLSGRFAVRDGLVLTAVAVRRAGPGAPTMTAMLS
jgi:4'-phosphopantetheinyl transferase EntD